MEGDVECLQHKLQDLTNATLQLTTLQQDAANAVQSCNSKSLSAYAANPLKLVEQALTIVVDANSKVWLLY